MEIVKRRLFHLCQPFRRYQTAVFIPKYRPSPLATGSSGDQILIDILEECKLSHNFNTGVYAHGRIVKHGYGMYSSLLSQLVMVYVSCGKRYLARQVLDEICFSDFGVVSANMLIDNLMRVGEVDLGKRVFSVLPTRDVVTWNSTIKGCVRNGLFAEGIGMFNDMLGTEIEPDGFTFASLLTACSRLGALSYGKWVHGLMTERKIELNYILSSALVDMYSRCGRIGTAKSVFDGSTKTDVSIWNAMINAFAMHGLAVEAMSLFSMMEKNRIKPDPITFIGILTACGHCGFVEEGRKYFYLMQKNYLMQPQLEHYGAMVDLFGRAGLLEEAYSIIKEMPVEPDVVIWRALLSACRTHKHSDLGEVAITNIRHLASGDYVLLSNMYCSIRKWDCAEDVRHVMNKKRVSKIHGKSWIECQGSIHHFRAGDRSHPDTEAIYKVLQALVCQTKLKGHVSEGDLVLMDISEEEKEENLNYHSEKLALAFGILKTSPGTEVSISKNLRTCLDCHSWMKIVSQILHRVIIIRDRIRFHRFENGSCSCGDYW